MIIIKIIIQVLVSFIFGILWYSFLINERGKFGKGDAIDIVQAVLMGIIGFLLSGIFLYQ